MAADLESLLTRFTTVGAMYDDATCTWFVYADPFRCVLDDCRYKGTGDTLAEAIADLLTRSP